MPQFKRQVRKLIARFWPGGLTLVLPKTRDVPDASQPGPNVAVRVPALPLARDLIQGMGGVLAVTSANLSGQFSPITAGEVETQLGGRIDLILDGGPCRGGVPSSLLDCTISPPLLLRRGMISVEDLRAVVGAIEIPLKSPAHRASPMTTDNRKPLSNILIPAFLFVAVFTLYAATAAPATLFGDPSEYQFIPAIAGIAHPPGYAFYTLLARPGRRSSRWVRSPSAPTCWRRR